VTRGLAIWRRRAGLLAAAVLFLAANGAFFLWYRGTAESRQEALEARRTALAAEATSAEREAARLDGQSRRLSQVSAAIGDFYGKRIGTQRATLAAIVDEIHATLKRVGIAPAQIAYTIAPMKGLPLSQMTAGFTFAADYQKFKRLLEAFETGSRWIVVREIALQGAPETPGSISARLTVATYFSEEPPPDTPPSAPRGTPAKSARRRS